jgi:hypothetical protein
VTHLNEEQLALAYYGDVASDMKQHLSECRECTLAFQQISSMLSGLPECPAPERPAGWETDVWNRLVPGLTPMGLTPRRPASGRQLNWLRWWVLAPAGAALLVLTFVGGMLTEHRAEHGISASASGRVLLLTTGDHLDRSERVLVEVANAQIGVTDFAEERTRARDLLLENRLLRQMNAHRGNAYGAALLDELERTLLDIAHTPADPSPQELDTLQRRIDSEGLLFRIRIAGTNLRKKEQMTL